MNTPHLLIGSDHEGVELKNKLKTELEKLGYTLTDVGTESDDPVDYPVIAIRVAEQVSQNPKDTRGVLICGTGIGMSMVANRFPGVLAGQAWNEDVAKRSREDDNINVLCLSAGFIDVSQAVTITKTWLETPFSGAERHLRRLSEVVALDHKP